MDGEPGGDAAAAPGRAHPQDPSQHSTQMPTGMVSPREIPHLWITYSHLTLLLPDGFLGKQIF